MIGSAIYTKYLAAPDVNALLLSELLVYFGVVRTWAVINVYNLQAAEFHTLRSGQHGLAALNCTVGGGGERNL